MSATELQTLRGCMKKDPKAYLDELMLQLRHFEANLEIFRTRPSRASQVGHRAYRARCACSHPRVCVCAREPRFVSGPDGWDTCTSSSPPTSIRCSMMSQSFVPQGKYGKIPEKQRPRVSASAHFSPQIWSPQFEETRFPQAEFRFPETRDSHTAGPRK